MVASRSASDKEVSIATTQVRKFVELEVTHFMLPVAPLLERNLQSNVDLLLPTLLMQ